MRWYMFITHLFYDTFSLGFIEFPIKIVLDILKV